MPTQWVKLPPNLVEDKRFQGKSVYQGDFCKWRPQIVTPEMKKSSLYNRHAAHSAGPSRETMINRQTGDYLDYKNEYDAKLSFVKTLNKDLRTPSSSRSSTTVPRYEKELLQKYLKPSTEAVKEAWKAEADTNKRERGRLYGIAGQRIDLKARPEKPKKQYKPKQLPGFEKWLGMSNEYEKAVVYNFMNSVTRATEPSQPKTLAQATQTSPINERAQTVDYKPLANAQLTREYYHKMRAKSAQGKRTTEKILLPQRPKSVNSFRAGDHCGQSEFASPEADNDTESSLAEAILDAQHHGDHKEGTCEFCDNKRITQLLEMLSRKEPEKFASVAMKHLYRPQMPDGCFYPRRQAQVEFDDYVHPNSFFNSTFTQNRGYFIIAPDWVSERKPLRF